MALSNVPVLTSLDATGLFLPPDIKITTNLCNESGGPVGCSLTGPPVSSFPVVQHGEDTFWPLSYKDDREAFAIVVTTESSGSDITGYFEAKGARYIDSIHIDEEQQTVIFTGEASHNATVPWERLTEMPEGCCVYPAEIKTRALHRREDTEKKGLTTGEIVGAAVGGTAGMVIIIVAVILIGKARADRGRKTLGQTFDLR